MPSIELAGLIARRSPPPTSCGKAGKLGWWEEIRVGAVELKWPDESIADASFDGSLRRVR